METPTITPFRGKKPIHLFIFMFCQIRLLFHKDLGQSGELSGLEVRERNVAVHAHSQGAPDLTEGADKLPSPGIADARAPGSQTPGPENRKPL